MAKNIQVIHDMINLLARKGLTGYFPPEDIDQAVYKASNDLFMVEYRKYEQTQEISDSLAVFKSNPTLLTIDSNGQTNYPANYRHVTEMLCTTSATGEVKEIDTAMLGRKLNNANTPPTLQYPIFTLYSTYIQFYPVTVSNVSIIYLKAPVQPVYAYTIVDGRYVYNDSASVDVEWYTTDISKVTMRALEVMGVVLDDSILAQFGMQQEKDNE
jgi:hypothetical protein